MSLSTEDATTLHSCAAGSFAAAVDKGLTDALLCSAQGQRAVKLMLDGVHAALESRGSFYIVAKATPETLQSVLALEADNPDGTLPQAAAAAASAPAQHSLDPTPASRGAALPPLAAPGGGGRHAPHYAWSLESTLVGGSAGHSDAVYLHALKCLKG